MKQERTFYGGCKRGTARICCCGAVLLRCRPCSNQSVSPTRRAHSSKPAARCCSGRMGQTDRRMPYRCIDAHYVGSANKTRWPIVTVGAVDVRTGDDDGADDVVLPEVDRPPGICGVAGSTRRCRQVAVDCGPCPRYVQAQLTCGSRQRQVV